MSIPTDTFPPYDDKTPMPTDIPRDSQEEFINNFFTLNQQLRVDHIPPGNVVKNATRGAVTTTLEVTDHYLNSGDNITLTNFKSINALGNLVEWSINGNSYNITVTGANTFTIPVNTLSEPPYQTNSGSYLVNKADFYGLHKKITFSSPTVPLRTSQIGSNQGVLFTQKVTDTIGKDKVTSIALFWQNLLRGTLRLTGQDFLTEEERIEYPIPPGGHFKPWSLTSVSGFKTPFGFSINFGTIKQVLQAPISLTVNLKQPYETEHWSVLATLSSTVINSNGVTNGRVKIPTTTLSSFDIDYFDLTSTNGALVYFLSIGR